MKLVSYNVNGIRAALKKGLYNWVLDQNVDIICFQETKAQPDQVDLSDFTNLGYNAYWHSAQKKGYSGVLTLSKIKAKNVSLGIGNKSIDSEGRVIKLDFDKYSLLNCYFPSGSAGEHRHEFKLKFLRHFKSYINKMENQSSLIVVGDYNIVHKDIDIHNPQRKDNPSGFRPKERKWLDNWFSKSFSDAFRLANPEAHEYSWWSYRAGSRERNKGWRIDYISVSKNLSDNIMDAGHYSEAKHSDHCPVWLNLNI